MHTTPNSHTVKVTKCHVHVTPPLMFYRGTDKTLSSEKGRPLNHSKVGSEEWRVVNGHHCPGQTAPGIRVHTKVYTHSHSKEWVILPQASVVYTCRGPPKKGVNGLLWRVPTLHWWLPSINSEATCTPAQSGEVIKQ